ncbi:hypothetical protein Lal_00043634 [Lupinus albus]|nr:hypothetical protein Lal_00043634 [Lupinus albus]
MSSQNEVNEEGTMVSTQTPITPQTPVTPQTRNGQPLNNKGGNKLVSYIGVLVRRTISIKFKHWSDDSLNALKDIIWKDITASFDVDKEHKDYIMKTTGKTL